MSPWFLILLLSNTFSQVGAVAVPMADKGTCQLAAAAASDNRATKTAFCLRSGYEVKP